jgi:Tfp pilus assembly protein PilN
MRLVTVAAVMGAVLAGASAALLVPTYTYLLQAERASNMRLADASKNLAAVEETDLAKRLQTLEGDATAIAALATTTTGSSLVRTLLTVPRAGVVLSDIEYSPAAGGRAGTVAVSGIAATRNDLRAFELALESVKSIAAANLPVSSYAKDQNLPFTILVTLSTTTKP